LDSQTHNIEEVAQNARDNIDLLKYYVLDSKIFQFPDSIRRPELLKPIVNLSRIKDALLELNNNRIRNATNFLDKLVSDNTVGNRFTFPRFFLLCNMLKYFDMQIKKILHIRYTNFIFIPL